MSEPLILTPVLLFFIGIFLTVLVSGVFVWYLPYHFTKILEDCGLKATDSWAQFFSLSLFAVPLLFALLNPAPIELMVQRNKEVRQEVRKLQDEAEKAQREVLKLTAAITEAQQTLQDRPPQTAAPTHSAFSDVSKLLDELEESKNKLERVPVPVLDAGEVLRKVSTLGLYGSVLDVFHPLRWGIAGLIVVLLTFFVILAIINAKVSSREASSSGVHEAMTPTGEPSQHTDQDGNSTGQTVSPGNPPNGQHDRS